jgi:DNA gyrase subunit A
VINLSVLRHVEATMAERAAYVRAANAKRRGNGEEETDTPAALEPSALESDEPIAEVNLTPERFAELEAAEEMLLAVTDIGFGKRSSAYEYRVTGRGGQGIANITLSVRNGRAVAATFPVRQGDDVMMVTDAGRLIRVPADQVRITGRQAMGVTLFRVVAGEHVTSVFPVLEDDTDDAGPDTGLASPAPDAGDSGDASDEDAPRNDGTSPPPEEGSDG